MTILDRYIGIVVVKGTLVSMAVLLSLLGILELANELNDVGKGNYSVTDAFTYVALIMPGLAYELFPVGALLGSLAGLGVLANRSEFVAMRTAGISLARIVLSVIKTGVLMMLVVILLGELIAPVSEQKAQNLRSQAMTNQITLHSRYGFWARDGRSFVNIRKILSGSSLADVYIYEYDDARRLQRATHAAHAEYVKDHWQLQGVRRNEFSARSVGATELNEANWSSALDPGLLGVLAVQPNVLPVWGLYRYIVFMRENGQSAITYEVALWGKLAAPLVTLVMLFLSIPFVFGPLREVSIGQRVFLGTLVGLVFFLTNKAVAHLAAAYGLNPLLAAFSPALLLLGVAYMMMRKVY